MPTRTAAHDRLPRNSRLWAITAYFNPVPFRRRLVNYRIFRERLALPLLTVELAYGAMPELATGDADILVQIPGRDVMWQKERLLNLAIAALPASCDRVVWLDCDVIFADDGWAGRLDRMLDDFALVQPYGRVHYLGPDWRNDVPLADAAEMTCTTICRTIAGGVPASDAFAEPIASSATPSAGLAWAAPRALVAGHGLYDAAIGGGGDRLLASAAFRNFQAIPDQHRMNERRRAHFEAWARPWADAVAGNIGMLDVDIYNQWHGHTSDRGYGPRHERFAAFAYDPFTDIALDGQGAWRWNSDKPAMHAALRDYFVSRKEDG